MTLLNLTNTGTGQTADFRSASDSATVYVGNDTGSGLRADVSGTSDGTAIIGYNYVGDRYAGEFEGLEETDQSNALYARTSGTGSAIDAEVNSNTSGDAIFARTTSNDAGSYAGDFSGKVHVTGTLSKGAGSFKIDHPLDPGEQVPVALVRRVAGHDERLQRQRRRSAPDGTAVVELPGVVRGPQPRLPLPAHADRRPARVRTSRRDREQPRSRSPAAGRA